MIDALDRIIPEIELFLLIFMRMSGLFLVFPVFGARNTPVIFRIGLALLLSYLVMGFHNLPENLSMETYSQIAYFSLRELVAGFVMGYISILAFSTVVMAGQLIDTHLGFGIVNILDPQSGMEVSLMGKFKNVLAMIVFFAIDGHHALIRVLTESLTIIPVGDVQFDFRAFLGIVEIFTYFFVFAIMISIPIIAAAFLVEIIFGIIVRTIPQMNIFVLGIPLKIIIGLVALYMLIPMYIEVMEGLFADMLRTMHDFLGKIVLR